MPYIPEDERKHYRPEKMNAAKTPGQLNYQISFLIQGYLYQNGLGYQVINDIVGALDGAKAEFQRRVAGPYEDKKIEENGDVYDLDNLP